MKRILHVTNYDAPLLQDVMNTTPGERYEFDISNTLENALLRDLRPYAAIVFDMAFRRGNINSTGDLGLYPITLHNDPTGLELYPHLRPDSELSDIRVSDIINGWIFAWLARIPKEYGGLGYRGGLMTFTDMTFKEVKDMFYVIDFDAKTLDERIILPYEVLYVNSYQEDSSQMIFDIRKGVKKAANIFFGCPMHGYYFPGTNLSMN